jgi:hypothetical protein
MTEKTGFKYSIKFNQSLSSGVVAFEGHYQFDESSDIELTHNKEFLVNQLKEQQRIFRLAGFKVASDIPEKMPKEVKPKGNLSVAEAEKHIKEKKKELGMEK